MHGTGDMYVESLSVSVGFCRLTTVGLLVGLSGYCRATVGILCRSVEPGLKIFGLTVVLLHS